MNNTNASNVIELARAAAATVALPPVPTADRRYYYVSIPYFGGKVFKNAGHGAERAAHRAFYEPHFARVGTNCGATDPAGYEVVVLPFIADRITKDDAGNWVGFYK
jgi:hypothetical protein